MDGIRYQGCIDGIDETSIVWRAQMAKYGNTEVSAFADGIPDREKVLVLGAGLGGNLIHLNLRGIPAYGCDPDPETVTLARRELDLLPYRPLLARADPIALPFAQGTFGACIMIDPPAYGKWKNLEGILDEIHKALRPGAQMLLTVKARTIESDESRSPQGIRNLLDSWAGTVEANPIPGVESSRFVLRVQR